MDKIIELKTLVEIYETLSKTNLNGDIIGSMMHLAAKIKTLCIELNKIKE